MGQKSSRLNLSPHTIQELRKDVNFTDDEIKSWYQEYKTSLRGGCQELTRDEFKRVYNSLFIGDASEFAEHVFRTFDKDGNGSVNFREFLIGLCMSGSDSSSESKLRWAFSMYDINGDGYISKAEMNEIVKAIYKMTNAVVENELDSPEMMTNRLFNQFDSNRDGRISFDEFRNGAVKNSVIVNLLECDPSPEHVDE